MSQEIDFYKVYADQLRDGKVEKIDRFFSPEVMDIQDFELVFKKSIHVKGEVYQSDDSLILHLSIDAAGVIPCTVCNEPVEVPIVVKGIYQIVSLKEIKGHVYDMRDVVRENVLLNSPSFVECSGGSCSERKSLWKYLKNQESLNQELVEGQQPFKDLSLF